jgi:branched-chain amino acid transport system permease protein
VGVRVAYALQQLINGITLGMIYGLIAVGYTMVYGIIGMINFAHGDVFMIGAFLSLIFLTMLAGFGITSVPLALAIALIASCAIAALYGWTVERVAYRPLRGSFRLAPLISAIGMSIVLQNFVQVSQGARDLNLQPMIPGGFEVMRENGFIVQLSWMQVVITVVTLALLTLFTWLVTRTPLGRAMRACEQDLKMAGLLGIDTNRTISLTFVIGAILATVAGMLFLLYYGSINFFIGFSAGVKAFTAAVLGGIGSLPGAVLGGLAIGLIESFWSGYASVPYKNVAAFSVLVIVLIFMPSGLLGRADIEKV